MTTKEVDTAKRTGPFKLMPWLIGAGVVALIAVPTVINTSRRASLPGEAFPDQGNVHIAEVNVDHPPYNSTPPTSGWHVGRIADWGSYDFVVPDELLVHNMEDGGVILWYELGTPEENQGHISRLEEVARGFERVVIAPREELETPFAATAWGRRQLFESVDQAEMRAFIEAFEGIDHHR